MTTSAPPALGAAAGTGGPSTGLSAELSGDRPAVAWREPAYVLLFVTGFFADVLNGTSRYAGLPISPDRLLFAGAIALVLSDPDVRKRVRLRWRPVHLLMVATLVWVGFSGLAAGTLTTSAGLYAWLDRLAVPFLMFCLAPLVLGTPGRRDLLLRTLTVLGIYLGLTAIFEVVGPHALVFPRFVDDPALGLHYGFARGPFLEAEADGLAMTACGLCAGLLFARSRGRWRAAALVSVLLCMAGGLLCQERSVWIGMSAAAIVVSLLTPSLRRLFPVLATAVVAAIVLALAASPSLADKVHSRAGDNLSVYDRRNTNAAAIRVIEAKPIAGLGWGRFASDNVPYVRESPDYPITNVAIEVHNVYLSRAAETGVPGGALFVGCLLAGPGLAAVRRRSPASDDHRAGGDDDLPGWRLVSLGTTIGWFVSSMLSPLSYPFANLALWTFAGLALAPYLVGRSAGSPRA